jgi:DNA-binding beta-propeller fold protein YncE
LAVVLGALGLGPLAAQGPAYPRINLATGYAPDPAWPKRPPGVAWAEMSGVAVDPQDRVYCFTRARPPIQVYDQAGNFIRSWGEDLIKSSHHIRIAPDGNVWVTDIADHTVREFSPDGKLLRTLGTPGVAGRDAAHFNKPTDVAVTPAGDIFVTDGYGNNRVVHLDRQGRFVKEWGELGVKPGQFSQPHSIVVDSRGRLYVADRNNVRIQVFDQAGKFLDEWREVVTPWGLCVTKEDDVWVCGSSPMRWRKEDEGLPTPPKDQVLVKFSPTGKVVQLVVVPKGADGLERPGELNWVHAVAVDSKGNLYVGDIQGKRAQRFLRLPPDK